MRRGAEVCVQLSAQFPNGFGGEPGKVGAGPPKGSGARDGDGGIMGGGAGVRRRRILVSYHHLANRLRQVGSRPPHPVQREASIKSKFPALDETLRRPRSGKYSMRSEDSTEIPALRKSLRTASGWVGSMPWKNAESIGNHPSWSPSRNTPGDLKMNRLCIGVRFMNPVFELSKRLFKRGILPIHHLKQSPRQNSMRRSEVIKGLSVPPKHHLGLLHGISPDKITQ